MKNKFRKMFDSVVVSIIALVMVVGGIFCTSVDTEAAETVANVENGGDHAAAISIEQMREANSSGVLPSFYTKQAYPGGSEISFKVFIPNEGTPTWWTMNWTTDLNEADNYIVFSDSTKGNLITTTKGSWEEQTVTLPDTNENYYIYLAACPGDQWGDIDVLIDDFKITKDGNTVAEDNFNKGFESGLFSVNANGENAVSLHYKGGTEGVLYVQYENMDYTQYLGKKAPKYTEVDENGVGYLFGGWYAKNDNTYTPIENETDLSEAATVVAKFVPAQTLSVKCQNWAGTDASSDKVIIRVVSGTDSKNYQEFGFNVSKIDGGKETAFPQFPTYTVYRKFNYYDSATDTEPDTYKPSDLFGNSAKYFTTCTVGKIPVDKHGTIICIQPYWKTLDGVQVNGLTKYAHVEDGYLHYVNVPVNLNVLINNGAAAGMLSVKAPEGLTFLGAEKGVEYGRTFEEMEFNVLSDGTIKCAGNTVNASDKTGMDIYINLKFKRAVDPENDAPTKGEFLTFTVKDEDFANSKPTKLSEDDVWNVIY